MQYRQENTGATSSTSGRIIAVDDEFDITFTLKMILEQSGFLPDVFNHPAIALSNFKPDYYKLILLDVKMPQLNGFELYEQIKKKMSK